MPKTIKVPKVVNGVPSEVEIEVPDDAGGPVWGPNDKHRLLNTKLPRADGPAKTTGTAIYTYDVRLPGMAHGRFVTSPHAHAKVTGVDTSAAEKLPGVLAVMVVGENKTVRFAGEAVAAVAATSVEAAEDAVRAVKVTYDVQPHVVGADAALKPDAPQVFRDNTRTEKRGDAGYRPTGRWPGAPPWSTSSTARRSCTTPAWRRTASPSTTAAATPPPSTAPPRARSPSPATPPRRWGWTSPRSPALSSTWAAALAASSASAWRASGRAGSASRLVGRSS